MDNREIAHYLERIGELLDLTGDNPFKARAYFQAAREISALSYSLDSPDAEQHLRTIPGIGEALEKKILELLKTGKIQYLEDLEKTVSPEMIEMLRIPGLGPRKLRTIVDTLGVGNIGELEYACLENRIKLLKGFGEKTQQNILKGIELVKQSKGYLLFPDALSLAESLMERISKIPGIIRVNAAGALRRCAETVNEIVLVAETPDSFSRTAIPEALTGRFHRDTSDTDTGLISGTIGHGIRCTIHTADRDSFPQVLHTATGSSDYLSSLRTYAASRGFILGDRVLTRGGREISVSGEHDLYAALGMEYIAPELRENRGEIEAAREKILPRLVEMSDIRGILHVHTSWSDGSDSIEEMALAARAMGMEYIGISDHTVSASYAGGLSEEAVKRQWDEIDRVNARNPGIQILKGVECDIRGDGSPDYRDDVLEKFDFVIASVHSRFKLEREEMTNRILRAVAHPGVTMLGHPTGRLLLAREPYAVDLERVLEACAEYGTAVELNADPHRFDLDWRFHRFAAQRGIQISINPDAHSAGGLSLVRFGVNIARKGWLRKEDVLNTLPLGGIREKLLRKATQRT
jgi:DNA polymerase (family 10)